MFQFAPVIREILRDVAVGASVAFTTVCFGVRSDFHAASSWETFASWRSMAARDISSDQPQLSRFKSGWGSVGGILKHFAVESVFGTSGIGFQLGSVQSHS